MKKHNFYAGPSILSPYTIKNTADAVLDFANTGLSILEVSHRSKEFQAVIDDAQALVKELLDVPEGYHVLFLGGGASLQFAMVPFNLLQTKAAYLDTAFGLIKLSKKPNYSARLMLLPHQKTKTTTISLKTTQFPRM